MLEIDTGLTEIKHFMLHNTLTEKKYQYLIYDISYPDKYRTNYDIGFSGGTVVNVGIDRATENAYSLMSVDGGVVKIKAPSTLTSSEGDWSNITWMAQ